MSHQEQQPDPSATTQQFQQFVRRGEAEAAADTSGSGKTGLIIGGVVIAVLVVAVAAYFVL
jgi:hypothetical protein